MVCEWGMSDELGPLTFGKKEEQIFLGREINQHRDFSEDTARKIDEEVYKIIKAANVRVTKMLKENLDILKRVAEELLEKETIVLEDIEDILDELRPGVYERTIKEEDKVVARKKAKKAPVKKKEEPEVEEDSEVQDTENTDESEEIVEDVQETAEPAETVKE
jgi:cell division protease FtsH